MKVLFLKKDQIPKLGELWGDGKYNPPSLAI